MGEVVVIVSWEGWGSLLFMAQRRIQFGKYRESSLDLGVLSNSNAIVPILRLILLVFFRYRGFAVHQRCFEGCQL